MRRTGPTSATRSILIALPEASLGTPAAGWMFTLALHGQDGFTADQARTFATTAQPYQFGLCPAGATSPICGTDPAIAAKVLDTITPAGVVQEQELDPAGGPVLLHGVRM